LTRIGAAGCAAGILPTSSPTKRPWLRPCLPGTIKVRLQGQR